MSDHSDEPTAYGFSGSSNWLIGGAVGGVVGSIIFGAMLWLVDPAIVTETIPGIYGVDPGAVGWAFHLIHGLVLGIVFGLLVSRDPVLGTITADVETGFIAAMGPGIRFALAGGVYGLVVWTALPLIVQSVWIALSGVADPGFPFVAFESLVGHLLYGLLLGALFSAFVETTAETAAADAPFEEASDDS